MNAFTQKLELLAEQAEQDFTASVRGGSVCQLHKQARVTNRLKYCEGRDYAVRRLVRQIGKESGLDRLKETLQELERKHRNLKDSLLFSGREWQAYIDGVLAMTEEVRLLLDRQAG